MKKCHRNRQDQSLLGTEGLLLDPHRSQVGYKRSSSESEGSDGKKRKASPKKPRQEVILIPANLDPLSLLLERIVAAGNLEIQDWNSAEGLNVFPGPYSFRYDKVNEDERMVVRKYCSSSREYLFDVVNRNTLMNDMENMPTALRYALCTFSSQFSHPRAPYEVSRQFFILAKTRAWECIENPSLESLQALLLLHPCAGLHCDFGFLRVLRTAIFRMASLLKLDSEEFYADTNTIEKYLRDRSCAPRFFKYPENLSVTLNSFSSPLIGESSEENLQRHLASLVAVIYHIREVGSIPLKTLEDMKDNFHNFLQAESTLSEWHRLLLGQVDLEWIPGIFLDLDGTHPISWSKVKLYIGYHTAVCLLHFSRAKLKVKARNWHEISKTAVDLFASESSMMTESNYFDVENPNLLQTSYEKFVQSATAVMQTIECLIVFPEQDLQINPFAVICPYLVCMSLCQLFSEVHSLIELEDPSPITQNWEISLTTWFESVIKYIKIGDRIWPLRFSKDLKNDLEKAYPASLRARSRSGTPPSFRAMAL
ncbi:hypothetical protein HDU97_005691 [Phlyctochytrium planicorne]|nr:hypothetical protein HDU97_005691 [Phlyctochytrium planicorne]